MIKKYFTSFIQIVTDRHFIKYTIIGLTGVTLDFIIYSALVSFTPLNFLISNFIAISIAILNNFFLNAYFNFKKRDNLLIRFLIFYLVGLLGILISQLLLIIFINIGSGEIVAKILTLPFVLLFQFFLNNKITFSDLSIKKTTLYLRKNYKTFMLYAILLLTFVFGLFYSYKNIFFIDEFDNILGGSLILQGKFPYVDYFSHHAPLTYFVSAFIYKFSGSNLESFRQILYILLATWTLINSLLIKKYIGKVESILFFVFTILIIFPLWGNQMLAESLILPAIILSLLLAIYKNNKSTKYNYLLLVVFSFNIFWVTMNNPLYTPLILLISAYYFWNNRCFYLEKKRIAFSILILSLPYILFISTLAITNSYKDFNRDYLVFNSVYYSQFNEQILSLSYVKKILYESINYIGLTISNITNIFSLNGALLFGWLAAIIYTLSTKKYLLGGSFIIMWFLSQLRLTALSVLPSDAIHHVIIWRGLGILFFSIFSINFILFLYKKKKNYHLNVIYVMIATIYSILLLIMFGLAINNTLQVFSDKKINISKSESVLLFNKISTLTSNNKIWAGPLFFQNYLNSKSESASRYYFFLPWQAKCGSCKDELISDFKKNNTEIILWDNSGAIWNHKNSEWGIFINEYLKNNGYMKSNMPELRNYYFKNEDIKKKVEQLIYDNE